MCTSISLDIVLVLLTDQARQITSSQDTMEEAAKLSERQDGGEHDGVKATESKPDVIF